MISIRAFRVVNWRYSDCLTHDCQISYSDNFGLFDTAHHYIKVYCITRLYLQYLPTKMVVHSCKSVSTWGCIGFRTILCYVVEWSCLSRELFQVSCTLSYGNDDDLSIWVVKEKTSLIDRAYFFILLRCRTQIATIHCCTFRYQYTFLSDYECATLDIFLYKW